MAEPISGGGLVADHGQGAGADDEEYEAEQEAEHEAFGEAGQADAGDDGDQDGAVGRAKAAPEQHDPLGHEFEPDIDDDAADHEGRQQPQRCGPSQKRSAGTVRR